MTIKNTDRYIGRGIYVSASVLYTKKRVYRERGLDTLTIINRSLDEFRKLLNLPNEINFRVAPIKGRTNGRYSVKEKLVEIDSRLEWAKALEVLAHELVHCEQYHTGKLKKKWNQHKGWYHSWCGKDSTNKGSTYKAYRNQPWEQEAFDRQAILAKTVHTALEKKYGI